MLVHKPGRMSFSILLLALVAAPVAADRWVQVGPEGGTITALAASPEEPDVVYAGTSAGGVFRSSNGGRLWKSMAGNLRDGEIRALAVDPEDPDRVWAGTASRGLLVSSDGGTTWEPAGEEVSEDGSSISALLVNPRQPDTVHVLVLAADGEQTLWTSRDGGRHWSRGGAGLGEAMVTAMAIDPKVPRILYAAEYGRGVFKSVNGGATWRPTGLVLGDPNESIEALTVDPVTRVVYAGMSRQGAVLRSRDGGATWRASTRGLKRRAVLSLAARNGILYAGTATEFRFEDVAGGVFRSTDGGATWTNASQGLGVAQINAVAFDPRNPRKVLAGASFRGVYRSTNRGSGWRLSNRGLSGAPASRLVFDRQRHGTAYAGTLQAGLWKSENGTASWQLVNPALASTTVWALALDPQSETVYAGGRGLWKSPDGGRHWTRLDLEDFVLSVLVDPEDPDRLHAGALHRMLRSADGGATWTVPAGDFGDSGCTRFWSLLWSLGALYSGGEYICGAEEMEGGGIFKSVDQGASYTQSDQGISPIDPPSRDLVANSTSLFAAVYGVWRSMDRGVTWEPSGLIGSGGDSSIVSSLVLIPGDPATLYAGHLKGGRVHVSRDAGGTWEPVDATGLEGLDIYDLAVEPGTGDLYAATSGGVFRLVRED